MAAILVFYTDFQVAPPVKSYLLALTMTAESGTFQSEKCSFLAFLAMYPNYCCDFSATTWSKAWFSNQHYSEDSYNQLHIAVSKLNCPKALRCFSTHWIQDRSVLDVPRSNMVAERAVKLMEALHSTCKTDKYLNSKFINSNSEI